MGTNIPQLETIHIREIMDQVFLGEMIFEDRPIISQKLLEDLEVFRNFVYQKGNQDENPFFVLTGQKNSGVFNLGGDLKLFSDCIQNKDRETLFEYARFATKAVYETYISIKNKVTTVAIINGTTVGGGFEFALSCDFIIAEKGHTITFSETKLGFFPGSGAYELLLKRMPANEVKKFLLNGEVFTTEKLFEMGLVDYLVEQNEAEDLLKELVKKERKDQSKFNSVREIELNTSPITLDAMYRSVDIWSNCVLSLTEKHKAKIDRIVKMQSKCVKRDEPPS